MSALVPLPGKTGRPNTLSDDARARLLQALRFGAPRVYAARVAGVGISSLRKWLALGRKAKGGYFRELLDDVERAEAEFIVRNLGLIQEAARTTWQAAAWSLERIDPGHFARKGATVVKAERGGVVYVHGVTRDEVRGTAPKPDEPHA